MGRGSGQNIQNKWLENAPFQLYFRKKISKFSTTKGISPLGRSVPQQKVVAEIGKWLQPLTPEKSYRKPLFHFVQVWCTSIIFYCLHLVHSEIIKIYKATLIE